MKAIPSLLIAAIMVVSMAPFLGAAVKIEWLTYLGIPLVILTGSAGLAFLSKRFEAIISGLVIAAFWPLIYEVVRLFLCQL